MGFLKFLLVIVLAMVGHHGWLKHRDLFVTDEMVQLKGTLLLSEGTPLDVVASQGHPPTGWGACDASPCDPTCCPCEAVS